MAKRRHTQDGTGEAVRSVLRAHAEEAQKILEDGSLSIALRVHLVRRICKKMRAVLRLIRGDARYVFAVENQAIREISAGLSQLRDAHVMTETLDRIVDSYPGRLTNDSYAVIRESLAGRSDSMQRDSAEAGGEIRRELAAMQLISNRLRWAPLDHVSAASLEKSYERAREQARRARDKSKKKGGAEDYHRWRKRTKTLYYQQAFLKELLPAPRADGAPLQQIGSLLGQANDDAVLAAHLDEVPGESPGFADLPALRQLIEEDQRRQCDAALAVSEKYFD